MGRKKTGTLTLIVSHLRKAARDGTMEPEQMQALTERVRELQLACRGSDPAKMKKAVDRLARIYINTTH